MVKVKTNKQARPLVYATDVPEEVLNSNFTWLDEDQMQAPMFFKYGPDWHHADELTTRPHDLGNFWHAITDEDDSGMVAHVVAGGESVIVGRF